MKKFFQFCKECVAELNKVTWPSFNDALSSIRLVLVSTIAIAFILGLLDLLFAEGLRFIF